MPKEGTIQDLVRRSRAGDRHALDELAKKHRVALRTFVETRLGAVLKARVEPEDIVQDTFLKAFQGLDRFQWRGEESFGRWLVAIAEHLIRNASRKRSIPLQPLSVEIPSAGPSASKALRRKERYDRLQQALEALSPDHRQVIQLSRIEGLKVKEIAMRMQRSTGAVKQLLSRALEKLRDRFGDTESLSLPDQPLKGRTENHA